MLRSNRALFALMALLAGCASEVGPKEGEVLDATEDDAEVGAAEGSADSARRPTLVGEIQNGETVEASFSRSASYLAWWFEASEGQTIRLAAAGLMPRDLDTVLVLYAATSGGRPSGASLALNDDHGGSLNSFIEISAPETRKYVALVRRYDRGTRGRISLSLELSGGDERYCGTRGAAPCAENEYCDWADDAMCGAADHPGVCRERPEACAEIYDPVCGCDGNTYGNACDAASRGVDVASSGECGSGMECPLTGVACVPECPASGRLPGGAPCRRGNFDAATCECVPVGGEGTVCGARAGDTCSPTEYCDFPAGAMCGAADATGVCRTRPEVCTANYAPVCACNGRTYSNACHAASAGQGVNTEGECPATSDCRSMGCRSGRYCTYCWGTYQCIPEGALC